MLPDCLLSAPGPGRLQSPQSGGVSRALGESPGAISRGGILALWSLGRLLVDWARHSVALAQSTILIIIFVFPPRLAGIAIALEGVQLAKGTARDPSRYVLSYLLKRSTVARFRPILRIETVIRLFLALSGTLRLACFATRNSSKTESSTTGARLLDARQLALNAESRCGGLSPDIGESVYRIVSPNS